MKNIIILILILFSFSSYSQTALDTFKLCIKSEALSSEGLEKEWWDTAISHFGDIDSEKYLTKDFVLLMDYATCTMDTDKYNAALTVQMRYTSLLSSYMRKTKK